MAQWRPARLNDNHGADGERLFLGGSVQHESSARTPDRPCARQSGVGHGPRSQRLESVRPEVSAGKWLRKSSGDPTMSASLTRWLSLTDVVLLPAFILWFIWRLQFSARGTWVIFVLWLVASFLLHRDTPQTLGWQADNLRPATRQAVAVFAPVAAGVLIAGLWMGAPRHFPPNIISVVVTYSAFCLLQQVALNSLVHNRMLSLVDNEWVAAGLTGTIFSVCHWPNPLLVALTFAGGAAMAWMFGRVRNIIPLAIGQAVVGLLLAWAFPVSWHHHMRVGPGYYEWLR